MSARVLLLNGSLSGSKGNTSILLNRITCILQKDFEVIPYHLADNYNRDVLLDICKSSDGFVFASGTYWDGWSSFLQKFFEDFTETEGSEIWLGKPAACLVSMHSVGGKAVLSRLQGTLNLFGLLIPPMTGMVYSALTHEALQAIELETEVWRMSDLSVICHNLSEALHGSHNWCSWPLDQKNFHRVWLDEQD